MNNQGLSAAQKLMQIKSGAKKQEMNQYVNAASRNTATFEAIPVPKPKGQGGNQVKAENKVAVQSFQAQSGGREAKAIEDMFDDNSSGYGMGMGAGNMNFNMPQNPNNGELSIDSVMNNAPMFNPAVALERAKQKQQNSQFLKFAQTNPEAQSALQMVNAAENPEAYLQQMQMQQMQQQQAASMNASAGFNPALLEMMKVIAKAMAEETITKVLNEYTQQKKSGLTFEYYNKEKTIIKTSDGKFYKVNALEIVEEGGKRKFRMVN